MRPAHAQQQQHRMALAPNAATNGHDSDGEAAIDNFFMELYDIENPENAKGDVQARRETAEVVPFAPT